MPHIIIEDDMIALVANDKPLPDDTPAGLTAIRVGSEGNIYTKVPGSPEAVLGGGGGSGAFTDGVTAKSIIRSELNGTEPNALGVGAVDLQTDRAVAEYAATGTYSFAVGVNNIAAGQGSTALNSSNTAEAQYSLAHGRTAHATHSGSRAYSCYDLSGRGTAQGIEATLLSKNTTMTDNVWRALNMGSEFYQLTIPENSLWQFEIRLVGTDVAAAHVWSYKIEGTCSRQGSAVPTLLESTITVLYESDPAYECKVETVHEEVFSTVFLDFLKLSVRRSGGTLYYPSWFATVNIAQIIKA